MLSGLYPGTTRIIRRAGWEHAIRDERDSNAHIDGCWFNPVKHGYVKKAEDCPFSSFHSAHRENPKPGDFERAFAEYAGYFGERD
jgi:putative transposase